VDTVPDPLLLRKCGSAGNRTRTFGSVARNTDRDKLEGWGKKGTEILSSGTLVQ
jgi:hypothetical protein